MLASQLLSLHVTFDWLQFVLVQYMKIKLRKKISKLNTAAVQHDTTYEICGWCQCQVMRHQKLEA